MTTSLRHLTRLSDLTATELGDVLRLATTIKKEFNAGNRKKYLEGKVLGLIFEKMSLRTRVSFEAGMLQLGGGSLFLENQHIGVGNRESVADIARVLGTMVDAVVFRAKKQDSVDELAKYCTCPVINALTDLDHPCQALADVLTIQEEFGTLKGIRIAWVGDCNNVASSLIVAASMLGAEMELSCPKQYQFSKKQLNTLMGAKPTEGFSLRLEEDPYKAVQAAHVVYTDVWVSMGQENEEEVRKIAFAPYQVNEKLMQATGNANTIFLHCLPAKRGQEVTDAVMDGKHSRVISQAANRMHAQKGLLVWLLR